MRTPPPNQWRLRCGLLYGGLDGLRCVLVERDKAILFDGRDNAAVKLAFWKAVTGYAFEMENADAGCTTKE